jgi:abhydrolase domain-containing protein 13
VSATIAVFWVIQESLVYKPTAVWRGSPKSHDMPHYEDVRYCTSDKVEITGWFIKQPPEVYRSARTLIYFHGTDKNASFRLKKVVGFYKTCGCNILLLSYRGYGVSTGRPNEKGMRIDAESALDFLRSRGDIDVSPAAGTGKLWVFGESLGGAVAVYFTSVYEEYVNALILENTFTSLLDMIKLEFPILGVFRYLSRNRWQSKKRIGALSLPILFLSGARDAYIPPRMMRKMHDLAENASVRSFVEFERGTHNGTWTLDGFYEAVAAFMTRVEGGPAVPAPPPLAVSPVACAESVDGDSALGSVAA